MITINVKPAKQRFGRLTKRKQWRYTITPGNFVPISDRDTYANVGDIHSIWDRIINSGEPIQMIVHYNAGPQTILLRSAP